MTHLDEAERAAERMKALLADIRVGGVTPLPRTPPNGPVRWQVNVFLADDVSLRVGSFAGTDSSPELAFIDAIHGILRRWLLARARGER